MTESVDCTVYKSRRQAGLYLYLRKDLSPQALPVTLRGMLGAIEPILELTLTAQRQLATVAVTQVMRGLHAHGYFLQMPPPHGIREARAGPPIPFPEALSD